MHETPDGDGWLRALEQQAAELDLEFFGLLPNADPDRLRSLEERANELRDMLRQQQPNLRQPVDLDQPEPEWEETWDFVKRGMIPEIDKALATYEAAGSHVEILTWQVGPIAAVVGIIAGSYGVLIDSSIGWFARKLLNHYTHEGYVVEPLNHRDDTTLQRPTRVRISRPQ